MAVGFIAFKFAYFTARNVKIGGSHLIAVCALVFVWVWIDKVFHTTKQQQQHALKIGLIRAEEAAAVVAETIV